MPKFVAQTFKVRREISGSVFLHFTTAKGKDYAFEISEQAFPVLGKHLAEAFQIPNPRPFGPGASQVARVERTEVISGPGVASISVRFHAPNDAMVELALSLSQMQGLFEDIGKAIAIAKSLEHPPATKQ